MRASDLLDRPIAFHRCLAELGGSVNAGLMLSQALYWAKRTKAGDGWFWKTAEEWQDETYLTRTEQATARKQLKRLSCWQEELRGVPAKLFYRVDLDELDRLLSENKPSSILETSLQESCNPVLRNPANKDSGFLKTFITETTSETTTETTSESVSAREALVIPQETIPARPHTPQGIDPVAIALEAFPAMPIYHQETIDNAGITQSHLWRKAVEDWRSNRYSARNITGLVDSYYRLEKQESREKEYQTNGQNGISTRTTNRTTAGERKAGEYLALQRKLGADASNDPDYKPLPGFEWLESIR